MEITHGSQMDFEDPSAQHRPGGIYFKYLSKGREGTPENYMFVLARQEDFFSPRHRHNFDQFRYAVKGSFNLGPGGLDLHEGQIAYHPEGVHYGPQNDGPEERVLLVLQCGGASGQGYLSLDQIRAANRELAQTGKFEKGKYYSHEGVAKPIDGYEAAWSHSMGGKKLQYPKGRYNAPIIMDPTSFSYQTSNQSNTIQKTLGVFSERQTVARMHKIEGSGSFDVGGDNAIHLLYVLNGEGQVAATTEAEKIVRESTVRLLAGTATTISSQTGIELLHFVMPMIS